MRKTKRTLLAQFLVLCLIAPCVAGLLPAPALAVNDAEAQAMRSRGTVSEGRPYGESYRLQIALSDQNTQNPVGANAMVTNTDAFAQVSVEKSASSENAPVAQFFSASVSPVEGNDSREQGMGEDSGDVNKDNPDGGARSLDLKPLYAIFGSAANPINRVDIPDGHIGDVANTEDGTVQKVDVVTVQKVDVVANTEDGTDHIGDVDNPDDGANHIGDADNSEDGTLQIGDGEENGNDTSPQEDTVGGVPENTNPDDLTVGGPDFSPTLTMQELLDLLKSLGYTLDELLGMSNESGYTLIGMMANLDDRGFTAQTIQDGIAVLKVNDIGLADYLSPGILHNEVGMALQIQFFETSDGKVLPGQTINGREYHFVGMVVMGDGTMLQFGDPLNLTGDPSQQFGLVQMNRLEQPEYCFFSTVESEALGLKLGGMVRGGDILVNENGKPTVYHLDKNGKLTGKGPATQEILAQYKSAGYENGIPDKAKQNPCALLGHDWGEPSLTTGLRTCKRCGETEVVPDSAMNAETASNDTVDNNQQTGGADRGDAGSTQTEENEQNPQDEIPSDHTHEFSGSIVPPTCTSGGKTIYRCSCGETFSTQETDVDPSAHPADKIVNDAAIAATCTVKGKTAGTHCSACNAVIVAQQETDVDLSAHPADKIVEDAAVAATCTAKGKTAGSHCSACNAVIVAQQETDVDLSAHPADKIVEDAAEPATCTEPGKTAGSHCSVCGVVIVAQTVIPAKKHSGGTATCKQKAVCETCGQEYGELGGHKYEELESAVPPSCENQGMTAYYRCSVCEVAEILSEPYGSPLGHLPADSWNHDGNYHWHSCTRKECEAQLDKAAHSFEDGKCTVCNYELEVLVPEG